MKNHRFYTLTIILLMATTQLFAGTVEMQRAKALGAKFVEANFMRNTQLEWVYTGVTESGRPSFHVFNGTSGGFVIVSACDLTSPILGYSESGSFNTGNIPDGLAYFLDGYGQSVDFAEESLKGADFVIAQEWSNLELCGKTQTAKLAFVQPLIATHWDQDCYYNACCPKDDVGPCGNVYAGCVATSMAQMMKYWNYPEHGTGSHSYDSYAYGILSADFGATTYYWDEMPESLHDNELYVSTLIFHCGVSVDMYYGAMASGALQQNIPPALQAYFGYGPSNCLYRDDYPYDEWVAKMYEALDCATPILYAGQDGNTGHAFICDGYDDNGLFHINWCWGGELDGYFSIDNLHTYNQYWTVAQKMIADARPLGMYNSMPKAPTNFSVQPLSDDSYTCTLHWNNPTMTLNNSNLTHIDQIIVKCDGRVVYTENNVTPGAAMEITDEVPFYGLHDYQVYAVNDGVHGLIAAQYNVRFGPSCTWTIETTSSMANGWQGAAIQVINNANQLYASATATTSPQTLSVEVPLGHVTMAWDLGNSNVSEVGIIVKDAENQVVYSYSGSATGLSGVFLRTNNSCGDGSDCGMPTDLYAEVIDDATVILAWEPASGTSDYNVYRDGVLLQTVHGQLTEFGDETPNHGGNCYYVTAFCASGESDPTNEVCITVGDDCLPATNLWYEMTSSNKVKLTWETPQPHDGLSGYYVYRTKEADMNWQRIKTLGANATSYTDNNALEDETFYLYKVVAYYQAIDCYSAPARSKYNEFEYFLRVYWSVDGLTESLEKGIEVYPNPGSNQLNISTTMANATLQVFNLQGRKMLETIVTEGTVTIDTKAWPSGMYFWMVYASGVNPSPYQGASSETLMETGKWIKE